jgi:hypothetical protein
VRDADALRCNGARRGVRFPGCVKLGFVGPARGDLSRLRGLCERLLFEVQVDRVFHLGSDDSLDRAMIGWAEHLGAPRDDDALLDEVAALAPDAPPEVLDALLAREVKRARLSDVCDVTSSRGSQVEMIEDRVVLITHDRASLDDDDVANALVVVSGAAPRPELRVVGGRATLTPGDLSRGGHGALLERVGDGLRLAVLDARGRTVREVLVSLRGAAKMEVQA